MAQLPPGGTRSVLNGLNPRLDYCFTVVAVYSTDQLVPSEVVCTHRAGGPSGGSGSPAAGDPAGPGTGGTGGPGTVHTSLPGGGPQPGVTA